MASNTPNLNLYKKDPVTDGNDVFNIETMLNENWDKIDKSAAKLGKDGFLPSSVLPDDIQKNKLTLSNGTLQRVTVDLNTLKGATRFLYANSGCTNKPPEFGEGLLEVFRLVDSTDRTIQRATDAVTFRTFVRMGVNTTWSPWQEIAKTGQLLANNTNLDDVKTEGTYFTNSAANANTMKNTPQANVPFSLCVTVQTARIIQEFTTNDVRPRRFIRTFALSAWQAWVEVITTASGGAGSNLNADMVDGYHAAKNNQANTLVVRDEKGYVSASSLSSSNADSDSISLNISDDEKQARLRIGGTSQAAGNGFEIQGVANRKLFKVANNGQVTNFAPDGVAPLVVTSKTIVNNLNADMVDGYHAGSGSTGNTIAVRNPDGILVAMRMFLDAPNGTSPIRTASKTLVENLNADMVDGLHVSAGSTASTIVARDVNQDIFARRGTFNAANGVVPLVITSKTMVTNLNADMVDGYHAWQIAQGSLSFAVTTGTAAALVATLNPAVTALTAGTRVTIKAHVAASGAVTLNLNGLGAKSIKKPNGNNPNLVKNGVYTLVYDGSAFILQGEGGEYGQVTADKVLSGVTFGTENGLSTGTIPVRDNVAVDSTKIVPDGNGAVYLNMPAGYYTASASVKGYSPDFRRENILSTANILGLQGGVPVRPAQQAALSMGENPNNLSVYARIPLGAYMAETSPGNAEIVIPYSMLANSENTKIRPEDIRAGTWIYGVQGTLQEGAQYYEQLINGPYGTYRVNIPFDPKLVHIELYGPLGDNSYYLSEHIGWASAQVYASNAQLSECTINGRVLTLAGFQGYYKWVVKAYR